MPSAFYDSRDELAAHPTRSALGTDVGQLDGSLACDTGSAGPAHSPVRFADLRNSSTMSDVEPHALPAWMHAVLDDRGNGTRFLAFLLAEPPRPDKRHLDAACGVRARDGARPYPRDDCCLRPIGQRRLWI